MNDLHALMQQIIIEPEKDILRLMYADKLDEIEERETPRAEFIRVQVELATIRSSRTEGEWICEKPEPDERYAGSACGRCHPCKLRRRERELRIDKSNWWKWVEGIQSLNPERIIGDAESGDTDYAWHCRFTRGFISEVKLSAETFLQVAPEMVWNPEMTDDVGKCSCSMYGRDGWVLNFRGKWEECETCKGTGRKVTPRPCPETVQPIEKVTLTTTKYPLELGADLYSDDKGKVYSDKYIGIEFELPEYRPTTGGARWEDQLGVERIQ